MKYLHISRKFHRVEAPWEYKKDCAKTSRLGTIWNKVYRINIYFTSSKSTSEISFSSPWSGAAPPG